MTIFSLIINILKIMAKIGSVIFSWGNKSPACSKVASLGYDQDVYILLKDSKGMWKVFHCIADSVIFILYQVWYNITHNEVNASVKTYAALYCFHSLSSQNELEKSAMIWNAKTRQVSIP